MMNMISDIQYLNDTSSFDSDDLLSLPDDLLSLPVGFISQNEYNEYSIVYDDISKKEIFASLETDEEHSPRPFTNDPSKESHLPNLKCGVCSAPAYGYNFDQITCESCKAFFRRNALRDMTHLKCRFSGSCVIDIHTRRQCTYCRLKKCFDIKMRKDWIRTEEERELRQLQKLAKEQKKLNKLTDNSQTCINLPLVARKKKRLIIKAVTEEFVVKPVNIYTINYFGYNHNLSDNDRIILNNITNAYQLGADKADSSHVDKYSPSTSFLQFLNDESIMHGSLIWFYKSIPHFKQLDIDDQVLLIKCNLINIIHLHHIIVQNFQDNSMIGKHMSKWIDEDFHQQMSRTRRYFYCFMKYPLVLKLTLIVFIFSINLSTPRGSSQFDEYKNGRKLYEYQNYYTTILWRYLNHLFEEKEAIHALEIIVMQILHYQKLMIIMESHVRQGTHHNILHSLMQSIFGLN